ncbi:hypothetical protein FRC04_003878 [Tulasnella sp. 424]|nr:hypothetical protein FRC04_003878 [Tulasnella sp. 424]
MPTTTSTSSAPPLPTTTNTLKARERADLVRRTRKLEQVLGVAMHVVEARNSIEEAVPSASSSPGAGGAAGGSGNSVSDRIEIPDASSSTSNSGHVPRRRLKSLRRPSPSSRPVTAQTPTGGVLISTSTQVHVDEPSETTTTTVVVSPPPKESTLPWYCSPVDMDDDQDEQQDSVVVRSKQSLVFASSSQSLLGNDLPALPTPTTTTSYVFPSPTSSRHLSVVHSTVTRGRGRDRSSSVTSTATLDSIASTSTFILPDPRQRQVNQALKLQRRLGESIPPELLQGSQQASSSSSDLPASSLDSASSKRRKVSHKPSFSLRISQKKKPKHEQVQIVVEPAGATRSVPEERQRRRRSHRRVHSDDVDVMKLRVVNSEADLPATGRSPSRGTDWTSTVATLPPAWASDTVLPTRTSRSQDGFEQDSESRHLLSVSPTTPVYIRKPVRDAEEEDDGRRMTPKEKALNVRRAQKMTKKFGQAPPHALFQITTNNASSTKISINIDLDLTSTSSLRRQSTTYTLSVPRSPAASSTWSFHGDENDAPTPTAETDPSSIRVRRRSSLGSFVVSSNDDVKMGLGGSFSRPSRVKSIPSPIIVEFPAEKEVGALSPTTTAVTPTTPKARSGPVSPLKLAQVFEPPAPAPPSMPLSNASADSATANSSGAGPARRKRTLSRSKSQSFATKRRQATKLTKFFGVEYPDLYQAMVTTTTTTTTTTSTDAATSTSSLLTEEAKESTEKKPSSYHYQKVSAARTRKSSEAALPSRGSPAPPPPPPSAYKKRRSVVAGLTSSDSSSLRVGVDDSCRWSAKGPEEVEELMTKLRAMKA